jgi:hypothetical protein
MIFEYVIAGHTIRPCMEDEIRTMRWAGVHIEQYSEGPSEHHFSLVRTCRHIYVETASLPCTLSVFSFLNLEYFDTWLQSLTPVDTRRAQAFRTVRAGIDVGYVLRMI